MTVKLAAKDSGHYSSCDETARGDACSLDVPGLGVAQNDDVRLVSLPQFAECRGTLVPFDFDTMPFRPRRLFIVNDVPAGTVRGRHGHRSGQQLLVRLAGEIRVEVRKDGYSRTVTLVSSRVGLLVPAGVWAAQTYVTSDSALLVLCSERYDRTSYVDTKVA